MRKKQLYILIIILFLSICASFTICYIAFQENLGQDFYECDEGPGNRICHIKWSNLIYLGSIYFGFFFSTGLVLYGLATLIGFVMRKHRALLGKEKDKS
jgi:hypothetical protein